MLKHIYLFFLLYFSQYSVLVAQNQLTNFIVQEGDKGSDISGFVTCGDQFFFSAYEEGRGRELWVSDGTVAGTKIVKDIYVGRGDGLSEYFYRSVAVLGNKMYFIADDGTPTKQLWCSNGTEAGTYRVSDFKNGGIRDIELVGNVLFILFDSSRAPGLELWSYHLKEETFDLIRSGFDDGYAFSAMDCEFVNKLKDKAFFFVRSSKEPFDISFWITDGTSENTRKLISGLDNSLYSWDHWNTIPKQKSVSFQGKLFFVVQKQEQNFNRGEVSILQWSGSGLSLFKTLFKKGNFDPQYIDILARNEWIYILLSDKWENRISIWRSDGTSENTEEIYQVSSKSEFQVSNLQINENALIFTGPGADSGSALVTLDLETFKSREIAKIDYSENIDRSLDFTSHEHYRINRFNGDKYILAAIGDERITSSLAVWISDLTKAGTRLVPHFKQISELFEFNGEYYFAGNYKNLGEELLKLDGSLNQIELVANVNTHKYGFEHSEFIHAKGKIYFNLDVENTGEELWVYETDTDSSYLVKDILDGKAGSWPRFVTMLGNNVYFWADTTDHQPDPLEGYSGLFKSDGTKYGTNLFKVPDLPSAPFLFRHLTPDNEFLYFVVILKDGTNYLGKTDGKQFEWIFKVDRKENTSRRFISQIIPADQIIYILLDSKIKDSRLRTAELWKLYKKNGELKLIKQFEEQENLIVEGKKVVENKLFFTLNTRNRDDYELWCTDGTEANTQVIKDSISWKHTFTPFGNKMAFSTKVGENSIEYWISDGTKSGTFKLLRGTPISYPLGHNSYNFNISNIGLDNELYFSFDDSVSGKELWRTDGTPNGTNLAFDINTGSMDSNPAFLVADSVNNRLFFSAYTEEFGREPWTYDCETGQAYQVADIMKGAKSSYPRVLHTKGGKLFFWAESEEAGRQLWEYEY